MRAYAHAREREIIGIFTIHILIVFIIPQSWKSIHPLLEKNKLSFSIKQHVVFSKTTRRFQQNKPLIEKKEVEIAYKKWIEKRNRRCFIKGKLQCVFEFCLGGEILLAPFTSMSGILFLYETKRDAAKTSFATSPVFIILHHRKSVCSEVNLRIRG